MIPLEKYTELYDEYPITFFLEYSQKELFRNSRLRAIIHNMIMMFRLDYYVLSLKHRYGMTLGSKQFEKGGIEYYKREWIEVSKVQEEKNGLGFWFGGLIDDKFIQTNAMECRVQWYNSDSHLINDEVVDMKNANNIVDLPVMKNYLRYYPEMPAMLIDSTGFLFNEEYDWDDYDIMFWLRIFSDFHYPYIKDKSTGEVLDNRKVSFLNAPRYNSYLRDLRLIADKYNIAYKFAEEFKAGRPYESMNGIEIDGKIIYQEEIDEGRICLEDIL